MTYYTFPKASRLKTKSEFSQARSNQRRFLGTSLIIYYSFSDHTVPRLGISVKKQFGKAHDRNRFKRIVRTGFRLLQFQLPPNVALHVTPKIGSSPDSLAEILQDFEKFLISIELPILS